MEERRIGARASLKRKKKEQKNERKENGGLESLKGKKEMERKCGGEESGGLECLLHTSSSTSCPFRMQGPKGERVADVSMLCPLFHEV